MVGVGHTEAPERNDGTPLLAKVRRTVEDSLAADEMNPVVLEYALYTVGSYAGNVVPNRFDMSSGQRTHWIEAF